MTSDLLSLSLVTPEDQLCLTLRAARMQLSPSGARMVLSSSDLRLLAWRDTWDTSGQGSLSDTEWTEGGSTGGLDLGESTFPGGRIWLSARVGAFTEAGTFQLEFGRLDTVDEGGTPITAGIPIDSSLFEVRTSFLLDMSALPLAELAPAVPTEPEGRYWSLPMPSRGSVGLAAGAFAIVQLRVQPVLRAESSQASFWQQDAPDDWAQPGGGTFGPLRDAWQVRYAAELAFNAAVQPINFFFLVSAPGA